jgi:hypothetical protein
MLFLKAEEGPVSDSDGATGAHRLVGFAPWRWLWIVLRQCRRKIRPLMGVKRACPPHAASPSGGERGSPSHFSRQLKKTRGDFYRAKKNDKSEKCEGPDSNRRTPARQGPKPCAFNQAWQPSHQYSWVFVFFSNAIFLQRDPVPLLSLILGSLAPEDDNTVFLRS